MRFAVVLCALVGVARAQPDPEEETEFARELQDGITALQKGQLADARASLTRARMLDRKAGAPHRYLAKLSLREREWDDCIESAAEALRVDPKADTMEMRKLHAECRASAGRPTVPGDLGEQAAVTITANVAATVKLRGQPFGGTPIAPRLVPAGRLAFDIEKGGYSTVRLDIDVLPGIVTDIRVELSPGGETGPVQLERKVGKLVLPKRPALLIIDGVAANLGPGNDYPLSPGVHEIEIREPGKEIWRKQVAITAGLDLPVTPNFKDAGPRENRRTLSLALGGGGAVLLGVGVGFFYRSAAAKTEARDILAAEVLRPVGEMPEHTRADFDDASSRAKRNATISNVAYLGGLGLLGAGIYFFVTSRPPSEEDTLDLAIVPVSGGAMIGRTLRW